MQNDGVRCKVVLDMVFYSLTPQGFRRYSSSNLCPALSSPGRQSRRANGGGTLLVNRAIQRWLVVQFGEEASQTRDYCVARNATLRAARPDPSLRKERLLQDDNQTAPPPSGLARDNVATAPPRRTILHGLVIRFDEHKPTTSDNSHFLTHENFSFE